MPGHSSTHSSRGFSLYASTDFIVSTWTDSSIADSVCRSHFSTAPFAATVSITVRNGTSSFSTEICAVIFRSSVNCSLSMPSKHFRRCGCTRVGSFVSDRISSISSLLRKKKRGKNRRFFSRYAASPFWIASSSTLHSTSFSKRSLSRPIGMHSGASTVFSIISRHIPSTMLNLEPSSGICLTMSSEEKMGERYCHVCWHFSQLSSMSCSWFSTLLRSVACSRNGFTYGDADMPCTLTIWSSSTAWISSVPPMMKVPDSL